MGSRFLAAFLTSLLLTLGILGSVGYAVTRVAVSPNRDVFRAGFFEFDLAPGWWCEVYAARQAAACGDRRHRAQGAQHR